MHRRKPKSFDMARSILPSKARKNARTNKRLLHKKNRAEIRERLHHSDWDDDPMFDHCWTPRYMQDWETIVYDRRAADKLNHFERWAEKVTADVRPEDKLSSIASVLPDGIIGEHALSHLRFLDWHYMVDPVTGQIREMTRKWWKKRYSNYIDEYRQNKLAFNAALWDALKKCATNDKARNKFNKTLFHHYGGNRWYWVRVPDAKAEYRLSYDKKYNHVPDGIKGKDGARDLFDRISAPEVPWKWRNKDVELRDFVADYFNVNNPFRKKD